MKRLLCMVFVCLPLTGWAAEKARIRRSAVQSLASAQAEQSATVPQALAAAPVLRELASGTEVYHVVNLPWGKFLHTNRVGETTYVYTYGMDFGQLPAGPEDLPSDTGVATNPQIAQDLDALAQAGVEGLRWFMIPDGRNLTFEANGAPTGRQPGFTQDLHAALDLLSERGLAVVFCLLDGNEWPEPPSVWNGLPFGHADVLTDAAKRQALHDAVIRPILQDLQAWRTAHPDTPFPVSAIDLINEPERATTWQGQPTGVRLSDLAAYIIEAAALVHQELPGVAVTVGASSADDMVALWTDQALQVPSGQGQDIYSFHHYTAEPLAGPQSVALRLGLDRLGKRVYLQEFPTRDEPLGRVEPYLGPTGGTRQGRTSGGWLSGAWPWSFNGRDTATPDDPLGALARVTAWFRNAFDRADLLILDVSPTQPLSAGLSVQFHLAEANLGGEHAPAHQVDAWIDGQAFSRMTHEALEGGQGTSTLLSGVWEATPGSHSLFAETDALAEIPESDEGNNGHSQLLEVPTGGGDLAVVDVNLPAQVPSGEPVVGQAVVRNVGGGSVAGARFECWVDGLLHHAVDIRPLLTGEQDTVVLPAMTLGPGTHGIWMIADAEWQVSEPDESNNDYVSLIEATGSGSGSGGGGGQPAPDLIITSLSALPEAGTLTVIALVMNTGQQPAASSSLTAEVDGSVFGSVAVPAIDPGVTAQVPLSLPWLDVPGIHAVWAQVDSRGAVIEALEYNNDAAVLFSVAQP